MDITDAAILTVLAVVSFTSFGGLGLVAWAFLRAQRKKGS